MTRIEVMPARPGIRSQIGRFLIVGGTTALIDALIYSVFSRYGFAVSTSKCVGFVAGALFSYTANKSLTFKSQVRGPKIIASFVAVYCCNLFVNVWSNAAALALFEGVSGSLEIAFVIATGVSASLNFLGMRYFVFANKN